MDKSASDRKYRLAIGALVCCALWFISGCDLRPVSPSPSPTISVGIAFATATPTHTPSPVASITPAPRCEGAPPTRMIVQERGRVTKVAPDDTETLNMRAGPSISETVLRRINPGELFFVLGGPTCADGYTWFQVVYRGREGWVAEGDANRYFIEPDPTG